MSINSVTDSDKATNVWIPKDANIIANRKMAFLFAQDLFGLKSGSPVKIFKERHKVFTVRELVSMLFLKLRNEPRKTRNEAFLYADALLALIDIQPNMARTVTALDKFLKIEPTDSGRTAKFNRLVSCFHVDDAWLKSQKIEALPFISEMKILSLLPKVMQASTCLLPSIHGLLDELSQVTIDLKASYETFVAVNGRLGLSKKDYRRAAAQIATAVTADDWTFYQRFTSDDFVTQQSIHAKSLCAAWITGHKKPLSLLQNLLKIEPVFAVRVLKQVAKTIDEFLEQMHSYVSRVCQRTNAQEDALEATLLARYTEPKQRLAASQLATILMARKASGKQLLEFGFVLDKLLLFVSLFAKESANPLAAMTQKESQDILSEIEALYFKEEVRECELVAEETIEEYEVEEEEEAEQEGVKAPPRLLTLAEVYERGLGNIIDAYLQQHCEQKSLSIISETAAFLCCLINKKTRFAKEMLPQLKVYESRCLRAAIDEAKDHLYLSANGFEAFGQLLEKRDLFSLSAVFRMLVLDWHGVAEQSRRAEYIVKNQKTQKSHHLLEFAREEDEATRQFLQALDYGLFWARFPASSMVGDPDSWPVGLQWMHFCQKLQDKIQKKDNSIISQSEIEQLHLLVEFVGSCQRNVWNDGCRLLSKEVSFAQFPAVMERVKQQMHECVAKLAGQRYSELGSAPTHDAQGYALELFERVKQKKELLRESEHFANIKQHLLDLCAFIGLHHANQRGQFDALYERNLFNMQWLIESSYRHLSTSRGIKYIKDHDFTVFQNFLCAAGVPLSEEEEKFAAPFNLREMVYYPRYVKYTRGNLSPHLKAIQQKIKWAQKASLHSEELASQKGLLACEQVLNGFAVVSKHLSQV